MYQLFKCVRRPWHALKDLTDWILYDAHIEPLELWTMANAFLWGAWLVNPLMHLFASEPVTYGTMQYVNESVWGIVAIVGALVQLAGRLYGRPRLIRVGARTLAALWMFGAVALAWQNWRQASIITYPMLSLASLLVSFRALPYSSRRNDDAGS